MSSLTLQRDSGYVDALRAYKVLVDGTVVGRIRQGETQQYTLSPGQHELQLKVDWCGCKPFPFTISDNENITFHVKSNFRGRTFGILYFVLFAPNEYLVLQQVKTVTQPQSGYEEVLTVTDYYDGPRKGIANFQGLPHFYECIFDEAEDEYSDLYRLTPISQPILELAKEDWAIWKRWEAAFRSGKTTIESHPALPQDRPRHEEIRAILDSALTTNTAVCVTQRGLFERLGSEEYPKGVIRRLQVRWADAA